MLVASGTALAIAFVTSLPAFEVIAIISFVGGVFLLASGMEATVKLVPSAESNLGPLLALAEQLRARGLGGKASFVPKRDGEIEMIFGDDGSRAERAPVVPIGSGLVASYERQLGPLGSSERGYVRSWLPRAIVKGLGLADSCRLEFDEKGGAKAILERPFVRPLCVREDFNDKVCRAFGCPLVNSIGEVLAMSENNKVTYCGCEYSRLDETAVAVFSINGSK